MCSGGMPTTTRPGLGRCIRGDSRAFRSNLVGICWMCAGTWRGTPWPAGWFLVRNSGAGVAPVTVGRLSGRGYSTQSCGRFPNRRAGWSYSTPRYKMRLGNGLRAAWREDVHWETRVGPSKRHVGSRSTALCTLVAGPDSRRKGTPAMAKRHVRRPSRG